MSCADRKELCKITKVHIRKVCICCILKSLQYELTRRKLAIITRKDIAEKANVSVSVVSRALNNSGYVNLEKRKRILQIAEELGYHPDPVAMSLMQQRTKQLLFYCKDLRNAYNIEMYEGMIEAAQQQGYMVLISGDFDFANIRNVMADGLIFPNEVITEFYVSGVLKNYYLPTVAAAFGNNIAFTRSVPIVKCDLWEGTKMMLRYLWDRGHSRIAMLSPYNHGHDVRSLMWRDMLQYELGDEIDRYFLSITREGLGENRRLLSFPEEKNRGNFRIPDSFFEKGELAAEVFLERNLNVTAVLSFNDEMALGFCKRMAQLGYRVPDDISVASFDGAFCRRYSLRELTSLNMKPKLQGKKCAEVLLDSINGRKIKYVSNVRSTILEGDTVKNIKR